MCTPDRTKHSTRVHTCVECALNRLFLRQIVVPPLPGKAIKRQLPFRGDDGEPPLSLRGLIVECLSITVIGVTA